MRVSSDSSDQLDGRVHVDLDHARVGGDHQRPDPRVGRRTVALEDDGGPGALRRPGRPARSARRTSPAAPAGAGRRARTRPGPAPPARSGPSVSLGSTTTAAGDRPEAQVRLGPGVGLLARERPGPSRTASRAAAACRPGSRRGASTSRPRRVRQSGLAQPSPNQDGTSGSAQAAGSASARSSSATSPGSADAGSRSGRGPSGFADLARPARPAGPRSRPQLARPAARGRR